MSAEDFAAFRVKVLSDRRLQAELLTASERSSFVVAVVRLARSDGLDVRPEDVEDALRAERRAWNERWI